MDINTCFATTKDYHAAALYSHLIPAVIAVFLSIFVLSKSHSLLAKLFALFSISFALWLIGDAVIWTSSDYNLVPSLWAPLDYIDILFYVLGAYFFAVLAKERDICITGKIIIVLSLVPAWWITVNNHSITAFNQAVCEALNNEFLTNYKFAVEYIVIAFIMFYAFFMGRKKSDVARKKIIIVAVALLLFFSTFSVTEYISSTTGIYEINLYSLFVLPVFLFMIVYAISNLEVFSVRLLGFQILPYVLVIMIGSQFFFLEDSTYKVLTTITFLLSLGFAWLFLRSGSRELEAHNKVETLADELKQANLQLRELDREKDSVLHMVTHQFRVPVTAIKWTVEELLEDKGLPLKSIDPIKTIQTSNDKMKDQIEMILKAAEFTKGGKMACNPEPIDLNDFFKNIVNENAIIAKEKKVQLNVSVSTGLPTAILDRTLTTWAIDNLVNNALKYTAQRLSDGSGNVNLTVELKNQILYCTVKDNGIGISDSDKDRMFKELSRATNATGEGTGLGLFVARGAIESQGGKIHYESQQNVGTAFFVELPLKIATKQDFDQRKEKAREKQLPFGGKK